MKPISICFVLAVLLLPASGCGDPEKAKTKAAVNHFVAASKAIAAGDNEAALSELTASIEEKPTGWAYYQRAKVMLDTGNESDAVKDCAEGLKIDPNHQDLKWFAGELEKPAPKRFKGRFAIPPSARK